MSTQSGWDRRFLNRVLKTGNLCDKLTEQQGMVLQRKAELPEKKDKKIIPEF